MTALRHRLGRALVGGALLCSAAAPLTAWPAGEPRLALIIDDLGYSLDSGSRAIALPGPLTLAVLPFTPNSTTLAELAAAAGKDVILHQPMQADDESPPSPGTLTTRMSGADLRTTLAAALADVPHAIGVNNHTGSLLTALRAPMFALMQEVRARGLFFLDSRTTAATVAQRVALDSGVPTVRRDVFLDNSVEPRAIAAEFERVIAIAREQGHAVLIAHPYAQSLDFLETALPTLAARGVDQIELTRLLDPVRTTAPLVLHATRESPRTAPAL
jgi:uncharacterized protein